MVPPGADGERADRRPDRGHLGLHRHGDGTGAVAGVVDVVVSPPEPQTVTIAADTESVVEVTRHLHARADHPAGHQGGGRARPPGVRARSCSRSSATTEPASTFTVPAATPAGRTDFPQLTVPFGTSCAVAETATGATATVDVTTTFAPGPVVDVEGPTTVVVTNTYTPQPGRARRHQGGRRATAPGCGARSRSTCSATAPRPGRSPTRRGRSSEPLVIAPLPAGASCTVTETDDGAIPGVVDVTTTISPAQPVVIPAGANTSVTVTNTYTSVLGSLTVVKADGRPRRVPGSGHDRRRCARPRPGIR